MHLSENRPRDALWRVLLVGHSMGGVVARAALSRVVTTDSDCGVDSPRTVSCRCVRSVRWLRTYAQPEVDRCTCTCLCKGRRHALSMSLLPEGHSSHVHSLSLAAKSSCR